MAVMEKLEQRGGCVTADAYTVFLLGVLKNALKLIMVIDA